MEHKIVKLTIIGGCWFYRKDIKDIYREIHKDECMDIELSIPSNSDNEIQNIEHRIDDLGIDLMLW